MKQTSIWEKTLFTRRPTVWCTRFRYGSLREFATARGENVPVVYLRVHLFCGCNNSPVVMAVFDLLSHVSRTRIVFENGTAGIPRGAVPALVYNTFIFNTHDSGFRSFAFAIVVVR